MAQRVTTPVGVINYPSLHTARAPMSGDGEAKFETQLVLDAAATKTAEFQTLSGEVTRLLSELAKEAKVPLASLRNPLRPNEERADKYPDTYTAGGVFLTAKTKFPPAVVDRTKKVISDENAVWSGQTARLIVTAFKYGKAGNRGVGLSLDAVQIVDADRPRLDGRVDPGAAFDDLGPF